MRPAAAGGRPWILRGHPRGLAYLTFTEAWERFSFYGMQALLVFYISDQAIKPGHVEHILGLAALRDGLQKVLGPLSDQAIASQIFGLYTALVSLMPLFGSMLGDRWLGQRKAVIAGALMMVAGHALMAIEASLLPALVLLIFGCGCLKGNISAQVGNLYSPGDAGRANAFSIFYVGINLGAFVAPIVCGTIGETFGWHYGFAIAALGMLAGLSIYIAGSPYLAPDILRERGPKRHRLSADEWRVIGALFAVIGLGMFFTVAYSQEANALQFWIRETTDRHILGLEIPVTALQALDGLFVIVFTPIALAAWGAQARLGLPSDDLLKAGIASAIGAAAMLLLAGASVFAATGHRISIGWCVTAFGLLSIGFLYRWPTMLALISRSAPSSVKATMIGFAFVSGFIAHYVVGWLGSYYEKMPHVQFWLLHAAISGVGAALIFLFRRPLNRTLLSGNPDVPIEPRPAL